MILNLFFYILFLLADKENELIIKQGLAHRNDALAKEDLFMAEHLISEGYKVLPPDFKI